MVLRAFHASIPRYSSSECQKRTWEFELLILRGLSDIEAPTVAAMGMGGGFIFKDTTRPYRRRADNEWFYVVHVFEKG